MVKSTFLKNFLTYSLADILGKSILLILSPLLTRLLTPFQYGALPILTSIWAIISIIQYGGFDFAYQMFRAQTLDEREREKIRVTSTKMAWLFLIGFWLIFSVVTLSTDLLTEFAGITKLELLFFLLAIVPSSIAYWSVFVFRFMHHALPYVRINLLSKVASILVSIPFILAAPQKDRLLVMLIAIFVAQSLSLIWVYIEYSKLGLKVAPTALFSRKLAKQMFLFGIAFFPSSLIYSSTVYVDRVIMGYFTTVDMVAILGLAVTLSTGVLMLKSWFSMVWDPQLLEWLATKNPKKYLPKLQSIIPVLSTFFFSLSLLSKLWGSEIMELIYPPHFSPVAELIPFYVLAGGFSVLTLIAIACVIIANTPKFRITIYSTALLVNVLLAIILIPRIGLKGAALGTMAGEFVILLIWIFVGKYVLKNLDLDWSYSILLAFGVFMAILFYEPITNLNPILEKMGLSLLIILALFRSLIKFRLFELLKLLPRSEKH